MDKLQWGIIGTGGIAAAFAEGVRHSRFGQLRAAGSRSLKTANSFADQFDIPSRHGSYEDLVNDPDVQAVYIATPHPMHAEWAIRSAGAGKHILCEKPVTLNAWEAATVIEEARRNDVFFMEAFMYRCSPQTYRLVELLRENVIGEVRAIEARFSFDGGNHPTNQLLANELGGGGILDVGCYCTSFARLVAGVAQGGELAEPVEFHGAGKLHPETGVDEYAMATLKFPGDIVAQLSCAVCLNQETKASIYGTEGRMDILSPWFCQGHEGGSSSIMIHPIGREPTEVVIESDQYLYAGEADHVAEHLDQRQGTFPAMTWMDTFNNMKALDQWRSCLRFLYRSEEPENMTTPLRGTRLEPRPMTGFKYRTLPGLDHDVACLAMGTTLSSFQQSSVVWDAYVEAGGNLIDTAFVYGNTDQRLGQWIKNRGIRESIMVLAKGAHTPTCDPESLSRELEMSLDALQTTYVDIYMMHRDNPDVPVSEFMDLLNQHQHAGQCRIFGASNWTLDRFREAQDYALKTGQQGFSALSNQFSLAAMVEPPWEGCLSASDRPTRTWIEENNFPLISWSSQAQGFFVPSRAGPDHPEYEWARCWYSENNFERLRRASILAEQHGVDPTAVALAYVIQQPFPTIALICPQTALELGSSLRALEVDLSPAEMKWLNLEQDIP